eukprot:403363838
MSNFNKSLWQCVPESKVSDMAGTHKFSFDRVFGPNVRQSDLFTEVAMPVVDGLLNGFNGTVFCYGQTGSGKTFTMEGADLYDENLKGLLPRMFVYLFQQIDKADEAIEFNIKCSYMEIYMEKIQDLLDPKKNNLQVKEDKGKGIYVADATEVYVGTPEEMFEVMRAGSKNRSVAATRMNEKSSRSHSVFILTVYQKNTKTDASKLGKLYLCDLAGSEKTGKTEASGQTLEEAKMINKSLSALGNVINALTEGKAGGHIPYRDSKLTRVLQESLGGNSQTCLRLSMLISQIPSEAKDIIKSFIDEAKTITNAKDFDYLMAKLKGTGTDDLQKVLEEAKNEEEALPVEQQKIEQQLEDIEVQDAPLTARRTTHARNASEISNFIMPPSTQQPSPDQDQAHQDLLAKHEEQAVQVFKLNQEIQKLKEELDKVNEEKKELEDEVKRRNEEIYQMNEKQIMQEINQSISDQKTVNDLQNRLDRIQDINLKRMNDISKLRQCVERLKCDLHVLFLSKKLNRETNNDILDDSGNAIQEYSTDSDKIIGDQIQGTLDFISKLEQTIRDDLQTISSQSTTANTGNGMIGMSDPFSPERQIGHERRKSQLIGFDTTLISEIEYINILPDMMELDDSSFLKSSFINDKINNNKNADNSKLLEQNQQENEEQLKKINELEKLIALQKEELEELNKLKNDQKDVKENVQEKEIINNSQDLIQQQLEDVKVEINVDDIKTQSQTIIKTEQTTPQDNQLQEELKQLKLLLEQKDQTIKETESQTSQDQQRKDRIIMELQQALKQEKEQTEKLMGDNIDKRLVYDLEGKNKLLQDKNKVIFTEVINLRKELESKDGDLEKTQQRALQLEKKLVLQQRVLQQQQAMQKVSNISQMMMPFQQNGQMQFGTFGDMMMNQQQTAPPMMTQPNMMQQNHQEAPLFFSRKVIKPVKGGGKGQVPSVNPYSTQMASSSKQMSQPLGFNEFMTRQHSSAAPNGGSFKTGSKGNFAHLTNPPVLGNMNAPIIKPEHQKEFQKQVLDAQQTPQQIKKLQLQQQAAMQKIKKEIYYQKYKEARELAKQQQIHEESKDSDDDDDSDNDSDEEGSNDDGDMNDRIPNSQIDIKKIAQQSDNHRRGKSVHHTSMTGKSTRPGTAQQTEKQKKSLKNKITSAFRNFF